MAGLAQKGGAVSIHCRLAPRPEDITAVRLSAGEADAIIGGDLVVTASPKVQGLMTKGRTGVLCNTAEVTTGQFTHDPGFTLPMTAMRTAVEARVGADRLTMVEATRLAERLTGDAIFANVLLLGAAWQAGLVPLSEAALVKAIELNGAAVEKNARAFDLGRWAVAFPEEARRAVSDAPETPREEGLDAKIARRAAFLTGYQNARLSRRYTALVERAREAGGERLADAVAEGYFKLLSYKDEYEVARLHAETLDAALAESFDGVRKVHFHLAPPILARKDAEGRPVKTRFGPWMGRVFRVLRHGKVLRGTPLDPFGWSAERRAERRAIRDYERDMAEVLAGVTPERLDTAVALARLPLGIRGFGHVKAANAVRAAEERKALLDRFRAPEPAPLAEAAE